MQSLTFQCSLGDIAGFSVTQPKPNGEGVVTRWKTRLGKEGIRMYANMRPRVKMGLKQGDVGPRKNAGRAIYFVVDSLIIAFSRRAAFFFFF